MSVGEKMKGDSVSGAIYRENYAGPFAVKLTGGVLGGGARRGSFRGKKWAGVSRARPMQKVEGGVSLEFPRAKIEIRPIFLGEGGSFHFY